MYVVKLKSGGYLRFSSYSEATVVDDPIKASLYNRQRDAQYQADQDHHVYKSLGRIHKNDMNLVEITFAVVKENVL